MKYLLSIIILFSVIFTCGFSLSKKQKPYVYISSAPVVYNEGQARIERRFNAGQRVYYTLVAPDGFKDAGVRFKIVKHEEKTSNWGYSVLRAKDIYLDLSKSIYCDYFVIAQKGHYVVEFYYARDLKYPFARNEFWLN